MCLYIKKRAKLEIAENDIICYKYLKKKNNKLVTPYMFTTVNIGKTYRSRIEYAKYGEKDVIENGLHSFKYKKDAVEDQDSYKRFDKKSTLSIVKCIIPKGSKYHIGISFECISYASNKLKYEKIVL